MSEQTKKAAAALDSTEAKTARNKAKGKMMTDEDRERGTVGMGVWMNYVRALGFWSVMAGMVGTSMLSQAFQYGSSYIHACIHTYIHTYIHTTHHTFHTYILPSLPVRPERHVDDHPLIHMHTCMHAYIHT